MEGQHIRGQKGTAVQRGRANRRKEPSFCPLPCVVERVLNEMLSGTKLERLLVFLLLVFQPTGFKNKNFCLEEQHFGSQKKQKKQQKKAKEQSEDW